MSEMSSRVNLSRQSQEDTWENIDYSESSSEVSESEDEYAEEELGLDGAGDYLKKSSPRLKVGDVQRALHPLQATADRVGKQVEKFAETLDRYGTKNQPKPHKDCRHVLTLVKSYKSIADDTVEILRRAHAPAKQRQTANTWKHRLRSSSGVSTPGSTRGEEEADPSSQTTVDDLKRWEQEEQTWDLLGRMLQVEYPVRQPDAQDSGLDQGSIRPSRETDVHRYSPEKDVWNRFLANDDLAWERHTVIEWLKKCADSSAQDIESIVKELESDADRGSGLWAHSWLYSKEAIKGQKRLRSWPQALDPEAPGIEQSLLNADRSLGLITQLDPDAITRQQRSLEKQDHYFERATWLACWEMVRRGKSWDYVREWCQERVEGWRAIAMRGDPRGSDSIDDNRLDGKSMPPNWHSRALWRKVCALAAKDGGVDKYENAVYGVLSGYLPSVKNVCESWDDYLFAHYNSYLLRQFDRYVVMNFPERVPRALGENHGRLKFSVAAGHRVQSGNQLIKKMRLLVKTGKEAREPFKTFQGSLIAKAFDEYLVAQGTQLALSANYPEKSKILPAVVGDNPQPRAGGITMNDHDLLRIVTHTLFIFQDLGLDIGDGGCRIAAENFVVAYVNYLSKAGKQQLLPLYASRLSPSRANSCLGRQLPSIRDHAERQTIMRLMKQSGIDVSGVLNMQLQLIIMDNPPEGADSKIYPRLEILEKKTEKKKLICPIRSGFLGDAVSDDEQDLVDGFGWYLLLDGHWQKTMGVGVVLYKHFLRAKGLAAARKLSKAVPFSTISMSKTQAILGRMQDISKSPSDSDEEVEYDAEVGGIRSYHSNTRRRRRSSTAQTAHNERQLLLQHSKNFRDLETFFAVLDAMEEWKELSTQADNLSDPQYDGKVWITKFQKAFDKVEALIGPLFRNWLQYPLNDSEAKEFEQIRVQCLPEVVLAYISILNFSGHVLSREILVKTMDLAEIVAAQGSDLGACFMASGRMPELMDSLALSSRNMIRAEESRPGKSRGKLDLWVVKPQVRPPLQVEREEKVLAALQPYS